MVRLVVAIFSGLFLAQVSIAQSTSNVAATHGQNVATIAAYDADGRLQKIGTGFIVEGGLIVTSEHVVRDAQYISSTFSEALDGEISGVGRADRDLDLAELTTSSTIRAQGLVVSEERLEVGSQIVVIGSLWA